MVFNPTTLLGTPICRLTNLFASPYHYLSIEKKCGPEFYKTKLSFTPEHLVDRIIEYSFKSVLKYFKYVAYI